MRDDPNNGCLGDYGTLSILLSVISYVTLRKKIKIRHYKDTRLSSHVYNWKCFLFNVNGKQKNEDGFDDDKIKMMFA